MVNHHFSLFNSRSPHSFPLLCPKFPRPSTYELLYPVLSMDFRKAGMNLITQWTSALHHDLIFSALTPLTT
jgi:hypothetical protein